MTVAQADLYLRLSLDREGQTSIERQEREVREYAARHGLQVRQVHSDVGISGYSGAHRPAFEEALEALRAGEVPTLLVWKLDRLTRRGMGQVGTILDDLEKVGGRIVSVVDGVDTSQAQGRILVALLSEMARAESETIGARVASAKRHARRAGRWLGGPPPYGLRLDGEGYLEPDPTQAPVVRRMVEMVLGGASIRAVSLALNEDGIPSATGAGWRVPTIAGLLRNPALAGLLPESSGSGTPFRHPDTGEAVECGEGVLTLATRRALLEELDSRVASTRFGGKTGHRGRRRLLSGLLRCAECGHALTSDGKSWRCALKIQGGICPGATVMDRALEDYVVDRVLRRLVALEPDHPLKETMATRWAVEMEPERGEELVSLEEARDNVEARLADLEEARYVRGEFGGDGGATRYQRLHDALAKEYATLGQRLMSARKAVTQAPSPFEDAELIRESWDGLGLRDRRALIRAAVEEVHVSKAPRQGIRFDGDTRVTIDWAAEEAAEPAA